MITLNEAETIVAELEALGIDHIFSVPGTQNITFFEALRRSGLKTVVSSDERSAAFSALGFSKASARVGVLSTIPGPGFLFALPAIAEAKAGSIPLIYLMLREPPAEQPFALQDLPQTEMVAPLVKSVIVSSPENAVAALRTALQQSLADEPGPVYLEIRTGHGSSQITPHRDLRDLPTDDEVTNLAARLLGSTRPVILIGGGAVTSAVEVKALCQLLGCPVLTTSSGRGIVPDGDPHLLLKDFSSGVGRVVPQLLDYADLIFVIGAKLSHNGTAGFQLALPEERLVRLDSSAEILQANYPASISVRARAEDLLPKLLRALKALGASQTAWSELELAEYRAALQVELDNVAQSEPLVRHTDNPRIASFFRLLRAHLPESVSIVCDSGQHQGFVRRYFSIIAPRELIIPADFQSMGFALPAAIGAALANPARRTVCVVGDGSFLLSASELLTAAKLKLNLLVIVVNDQAFGLIRNLQLREFGQEFGTTLPTFILDQLANSFGADYQLAYGDTESLLAGILTESGVTVLEISLGDSHSLTRQAGVARAKSSARALIPASLWTIFSRFLKRVRQYV